MFRWGWNEIRLPSTLFTVLFFTLLLNQVGKISSNVISCESLNCTCVGASGTCCGGYQLDNVTKICEIFCLEDGYSCCGCNPYASGTRYKCFGCPNGDTCTGPDYGNYNLGGVLYYCVSFASDLSANASSPLICIFLLLLLFS